MAPGGTLLIVGHLNTPDSTGHGDSHGRQGQGHQGHGHQPPAEASATASSITAGLDDAQWDVVTAAQHTRTLSNRAGGAAPLHDVVVRASRRT